VKYRTQSLNVLTVSWKNSAMVGTLETRLQANVFVCSFSKRFLPCYKK